MVKTGRHQQQLLQDRRLHEQAEVEIQEQQFQQELLEAQKARQRAENAARKPDRVVLDRSSLEAQDKFINYKELEQAEGDAYLYDQSPEKFQFMMRYESVDRLSRGQTGGVPKAV